MAADAMDVAIAAVFTARTALPMATGSAIPIGPGHQTIALPERALERVQSIVPAFAEDFAASLVPVMLE